MPWLHVKWKSCATILAAVDDRRKIILLQRVENVPKTFLEKRAWPLVNRIAVFTSASICRLDKVITSASSCNVQCNYKYDKS